MNIKTRVCKLNSLLDSILIKSGSIHFSATAEQIQSMYKNVFSVVVKQSTPTDEFSKRYFGCSSGFICFNLSGLVMQLYVHNSAKSQSGYIFEGFRCLSSPYDKRNFYLKCVSIYKFKRVIRGRHNSNSIPINVLPETETSIRISLESDKTISVLFSTVN